MKRGISIFELFLFAVFFVMLGATIFSIFQFAGYNRQSSEFSTDLNESFITMVEKLRSDARFCGKAELVENGFRMILPDGRFIAYNVASDSVLRTLPSGAVSKVAGNIASVVFHIPESLPGLVSVAIFPKDPAGNPQFTSVGLRGRIN